jgi:hypothetical protein
VLPSGRICNTKMASDTRARNFSLKFEVCGLRLRDSSCVRLSGVQSLKFKV